MSVLFCLIEFTLTSQFLAKLTVVYGCLRGHGRSLEPWVAMPQNRGQARMGAGRPDVPGAVLSRDTVLSG